MSTELENNFDQAGKAAEKMAEGVKKSASVIGKINDAIEHLGNGLKTGTSGFDDITKAASSLSSVLGEGGKAISTVIAAVPGLEGVGAGLGSAFSVMSKVADLATTAISETAKEAMQLGDAWSKPVRDIDKSMFDLTKSFGQGIDAARSLTDSIPEQALTDLGKSMHLSTGELQTFLKAAKSTNLDMQTLTQTVSTAYGEMDMYTLATAQASAAGIDAGRSAQMFDSLINRQGMSVKSASEAMAGFSAISAETGINFETVSRTLEESTRSFQKMGMSVDFGRPILENFAKTMKDVGLGIDVATEATQSLVSSLGGLSTNYGLAYLTQIRGGGGATAGGVLGTSIEMRQNLREAESTGDQGAMAIEMAKQMKDTIASLTGGNIITLDQASRSPELQTQFYMQGQMLSQYGINDVGTQDAVLDLLSKIDQAGAMGDSQGQKELAEQLSREIEGRDKTMDEFDKVSTALGSLEAQMFTTTRELGEYTREVLARPVGTAAELGLGGILDNLEGYLQKLNLNGDVAKEDLAKMYGALDAAGKKLGIKLEPEKPDKVDENGNPEYSSLTDSFKAALLEVFKGPQVVTIDLSPDAKAVFSNPQAGADINLGAGSSS